MTAARFRPSPATRVLLCALAILCAFGTALGHENKKKKLPKTRAAAQIKEARKKMDAAKRKLAAEGKYACCVRPSCDLCARVNGSCTCAADVAAGRGACGECHAAWQAGRGSLKGVRPEDVALTPATSHCSAEAGEKPPELAEACHSIDEAKRVLVSEGRYSCCVRGGCDVCAHEGDCPCGSDLAEALDPKSEPARSGRKAPRPGVCGECLDGWHRGKGSFAGVAVSEVPLADMGDSMATDLGGPYRTHGAMGSGTSLLPASSPVLGLHAFAGEWLTSVHWDVKVGLDRQFGPRGVGKLVSQNWVMAMAERELGPGNLLVRGMFSAEPITAPHGGFPQLFQTGETYRGVPILDAQHPHDLFMELSATYRLPLGESASAHVYLAPVGEPALGPTAFMHRPSAAENPSVPLGHHWQDSSHITHGVATLGVQFDAFRLEGSVFRGREPDDRRAGIEIGRLDSWSARVTYAPTPDWSLQVSHGRLNDAEQAHPGDLVRTTASIHHNRAWSTGNWASALIWGRNAEVHGDSNAYLAESVLRFATSNAAYFRAELVDKSSLLGVVRPDPTVAPGVRVAALARSVRHPGHGGTPGEPIYVPPEVRRDFRITAFTFGYSRDLVDAGWLVVSLGADVTAFLKPRELDSVYGNRPIGSNVFLRFRPGGT